MELPVLGWREFLTPSLTDRQPSAEDLIAYCRGKIAGYKIPRSIDFRTDPLPKTGPGKIAKRVLRDPFWAGTGRKI